MADLTVKQFNMINPFVVASSPATQGAENVLKSARIRPGAIVLRNFGHGAGGGSYIGGDPNAIYQGRPAVHSHAVGTPIDDGIASLEQYCEHVLRIKKQMDSDIKLWVSVGHYNDIPQGGDWQAQWVRQARELTLAGADALELHFNTPGVAALGGRNFDYEQLVYHCTKMIRGVTHLPVMVKLAVEGCDPIRAIERATDAGASAVGPTARWKAFTFDLNWRETQARPGGGYGGTQATPIVCQVIAEARRLGIATPMFAGGGVFGYENAARILMAGSQMVQLGAVMCSGGIGMGQRIIADLNRFMDENGYADMDALCGDALKLYNMSAEITRERTENVGRAYRQAQPDPEKCIGCGRCADVCWHGALDMQDKKAHKTDACIGCGYCFQVCPTGALCADVKTALAEPFVKRGL